MKSPAETQWATAVATDIGFLPVQGHSGTLYFYNSLHPV